jgi:hypothetical protein
MRYAHFAFMTLLCGMVGCGTHNVPGSPGVPEPIKVLENPATGERVRFFREIPFKVPAGYNEEKHMAQWAAHQEEHGFTKAITPEDDREQLARLRQANRAASMKRDLGDSRN